MFQCEVGFIRPREVKSKFLVKVALIASLSSLVIMIMILCIIFGWFWGIPSSIKKHSEVKIHNFTQENMYVSKLQHKLILNCKRLSRAVTLNLTSKYLQTER